MLQQNRAMSLAHKLYRADDIREHEKTAAMQQGIPMYCLMRKAGEALYKHSASVLSGSAVSTKKIATKKATKKTHYLVLAGVGNNAGDGYIAASCALSEGNTVTVCAVYPERELSGDAALAKQAWLDDGGTVEAFCESRLSGVDIVIDALLGTGAQGDLRQAFADIIKCINACDLPIVSADIPSGLCGNTGKSLGQTIQATRTVTFIAKKLGTSTGFGKQACGELILEDLELGHVFAQIVASRAKRVNFDHFGCEGSRFESTDSVRTDSKENELRQTPFQHQDGVRHKSALPPRAINSHKSNHGRLLCIGGNAGMPGAIRMCAEAALRTGAGLVRVFTHEDSAMQVSVGRPELMIATNKLEDVLSWATSVVIGPGLGQDDWAQEAFTLCMEHCLRHQKNMMLDADALNLIAYSKRYASSHLTKLSTVMTPHPKEASRLLGSNVKAIEDDRFYSARHIANSYKTVCVLKGAGSIIDDMHNTYVCENGNPGMATGGMGDVLSGIIAALLAQDLSPVDAARYGVCLHAKAADILAEKYGQRGLLASDLFSMIRELVNR